jgi:signal recognition particle receptor subunit beta
MAALNPITREVVFKLVFYGPGLGGKTTTLQYIHAVTKSEHKGKMVSLATPTDRTLYFDYLPIRVPRVRGMGVRLQLFTVPGQIHFAATRKLVLSGVDGIVFVADSQRGRLAENDESLEDLRANLGEHGRRLEDIPHTFHWNKRDLSDLVPVEELESRFNKLAAPSLDTVATRGDGVFEGLERITRLAMQAFEQELPRSERAAIALGAVDSSISEAIRGLAEQPNLGTTVPPSAVPPIPAAVNEPPKEATPSPSAPTFAVPTGAFSLAPVWPEADRESVRQAESLIGAGDAVNAVLACDLLVTRVFASAAALAGTLDSPRDPGLVALLLRLDGSRYLTFRSTVREARQRGDVTLRDAYDAYAFAFEARRARDAIR